MRQPVSVFPSKSCCVSLETALGAAGARVTAGAAFVTTAADEVFRISVFEAQPKTNSSASAIAEIPERIISGNARRRKRTVGRDRKSTRLNSSHSQISYAVFCLKKKRKKNKQK